MNSPYILKVHKGGVKGGGKQEAPESTEMSVSCPCTFPWQNLFRKIHGKKSIHGQAAVSVTVRGLTMQVTDSGY